MGILLVVSVIGFENGSMRKEKDLTELRSGEVDCMGQWQGGQGGTLWNCLKNQEDTKSGNVVQVMGISEPRLTIKWDFFDKCHQKEGGQKKKCSCNQLMEELFGDKNIVRDKTKTIYLQFRAKPAKADCQCYLGQAKAAQFLHVTVQGCTAHNTPTPIANIKTTCKSIATKCNNVVWEISKKGATDAAILPPKGNPVLPKVPPKCTVCPELPEEGVPVIDQLFKANCKCFSYIGITVESSDRWTKRKHADQMGKYQFEGDMHSGRPVYVKTTKQRPVYSMYWNSKTKAWEVGETVGGKAPTMKTECDSDQICPADPVPKGKSQKKWTRLTKDNKWGIDDKLKFTSIDDKQKKVKC